MLNAEFATNVIAGIRETLKHPYQPPQDTHPLHAAISGFISDSLSKILGEVDLPPEGTGVVTILETADGDVLADYSHRVIIVPPRLYSHILR